MGATLAILCIALGVLGCCAFGAWATYALKEDRWLPLYMTAASGAIGALWSWLIAVLKDDQKIYVASFIWDSYYILVYALLPVFVFGVSLNRLGMLGAALTLTGMVLLHASNK